MRTLELDHERLGRLRASDRHFFMLSGLRDESFRRNNRWIVANVLEREKTLKPDQTIEFGTPEFYKLVDQLVREG